MKGVTNILKNLAVGEVVEISGTSRANIYMLARRAGIRVTAEKFIGGFFVTRRPGQISVPLPAMNDKQQKLAELRNLLSPTAPKVVNESEPVDDWIYLDNPTWEDGEVLYWRHKPRGKPVCYKRESDLSGA